MVHLVTRWPIHVTPVLQSQPSRHGTPHYQAANTCNTCATITTQLSRYTSLPGDQYMQYLSYNHNLAATVYSTPCYQAANTCNTCPTITAQPSRYTSLPGGQYM